MAKRIMKVILIRLIRHRLLKSTCDTNRLLGHAASLFLKKATVHELNNELIEYYKNANIESLKHEINLSAVRQSLMTQGYKIDILSIKSKDSSILFSILNIWQKRLHLLREAKIRIDLLLLKKGDSIPPHAHKGVLSGFFVLTGAVRIRHFHVEAYHPDGVVCYKTIDATLISGGFTTNHDEQDNIHTLDGISEETLLFRFNITGLPSKVPNYDTRAGRLYLDVAGINEETAFAPFTLN